MADRAPDPSRLGWLDGLRGCAAMQVVLMHYVFAFLPAVAIAYPQSVGELGAASLAGIPLAYAYDGHSAVYLFFIMSGVVLTRAFSSTTFGFPSAILRRLIRLGLPMSAAIVLAAALFMLLPDAHAVAGARSGSGWFRNIGPGTISIYTIVHQIVFEGLLTGYDGSSLMPGWLRWPIALTPLSLGFDVPLWTLHIEFAGSLVIMLLVALKARASRGAYRAACAILGCALVLSPLVMFIVGHLAADGLRPRAPRPRRAVAGSALLLAGILLCSVKTVAPVAAVWTLLPSPLLGLPGDAGVLQSMTGALLVFAGLVYLPAVQRLLNRPTPRWLGKISFSLYLTHYPVLATGIALVFNRLGDTLPYDLRVAITGTAGLAVSLAIAVLFERWVDRPSISLSRTAGSRFADPERVSPLRPVAG